MLSDLSDAAVSIYMFLVALAIFSYVWETYAPKVLDWIEKQVSR